MLDDTPRILITKVPITSTTKPNSTIPNTGNRIVVDVGAFVGGSVAGVVAADA